ncbi:MAG: BatD family protein [Euryarchaeota archaeon]|nr:BatD family protein [Euryarchaeota archaeon]
MKTYHIVKCGLILIFILILSIGTASAFNRYGEEIYKGDGYQINNYLIEVFNIISVEDNRLLTINIYQLKSDGTYEELDVKRKTNVNNKLTEHKYQSDIVEIIVMEKNCTSTYATVDITTSGIKVEYNHPVKGGLSSAKFIGEPSLLLTKEVDKTNVEIGDTIRVTIKAKNVGSGPAKRIAIDHGITPGFTFKSAIYTTYPEELAAGNPDYTQMYIYEMEAAQSGTVTLTPATVTYYCSTYDSEYSSNSNSPVVTVAQEAVETSVLELTVTPHKTELQRGNKVTFTVSLRNIKDIPATTVRLDMIYPYNLTYESGCEDIKIIDNKPVIQKSIYEARYEDEYDYTFLANEVGIYNITAKVSYNDGVNNIINETTSDMIYIIEGEYDYLKEYPLYVYIIPIIIIAAIAGWIFWRRNQFKM